MFHLIYIKKYSFKFYARFFMFHRGNIIYGTFQDTRTVFMLEIIY